MKKYGWNPAKLATAYTTEELVALQKEVCADPKNQNRQGIWLYTPEARRKLDAIAWAITYKIREAREKAGAA